jgi:5-(carboxyamino)imidazole ribonucleotide synthase
MTSIGRETVRVGIVGGGQLARMLVEASLRLDIPVTVLGERADDPAVVVAPGAVVGDARSIEDLRSLAERVDVITFDHELVSPLLLCTLQHEGAVLRPSAAAMATAVDKVAQSRLFSAVGVPAPPTILALTAQAVDGAAQAFGGSVAVKTGRGGYDGRGVALVADPGNAGNWAQERSGPFLVQPVLDLDAEVAVQVVRGVDGVCVTYPVVRTVQQDGMCRVVYLPSGLSVELEAEASDHARRIAEAIGVIGVLAVEFFVVAGKLLVNEIAARPHNSGHITETSSVTSQFENHLRAICGLPLGSADILVPAAAMANVVGRSRGDLLDVGAVPPDVSVHLYGKAPRPGRKLGHVTVVAPTADAAVERALSGAAAINCEEVPR